MSSLPVEARAVVCAAQALLCPAAFAQANAPTATLQPAIVTGNPLGASAVAQPSSVLSGDALVLRRGSTLGETLDGLSGVSSTYFGPNANRPIIRGQDGDRIRVLGNGAAALDASSLSFDHAVPIDPLAVERIEVLRGPAALLYGGSAIGGVVNAIDNRIPRNPIATPSGALEMRFGGAAREKGVGALIEGGSDGFALHADGFARDTADLSVPDFDRAIDGGSERRNRVVNSASKAEGGAVGGSAVGKSGYLGAAVDRYRNTYGVVAEEDVIIRMRRDKFSLAGELRDLGGFLRSVRGHWQHSDYMHEEVEASGVVGTTFDNKGNSARVELEHAAFPLGPANLRGVFGAQSEDSRFSALGEEAFVPSAKTLQRALFVFEELTHGSATFTFGARAERTRVDSAGDDPAAAEARFGAAQSRGFTGRSAAAGALYRLSEQWQLSVSAAYTERAPTYYELYANGVHIATAAFERGDATLGTERGRNIDAGVEWKDGPRRLRGGVFGSRTSNYIALLRTGEPDFVNDEGQALPVFEFTGVPARLHGFELDGVWRLVDGAPAIDVDAKLDVQRASNRASGEPLPRLAPLRARLGLAATAGGWQARVEAVHANRQSRVPSGEPATGGYTLFNLSASYRMRSDSIESLWFARLDNAGDRLAFNAATIDSVRALAPLPGRSVKVGVQIGW